MASPSGEAEASSRIDVRRYLPLALAVTALVVLLPAYLVSLIEPKNDPVILLLSVPLAMGLSIAFAAALSALWARQPSSVDLVFGELMLWGWWLRYRAEKRLSGAATLISPKRRSAKNADEAQVEMLHGLIRLLERRDPYTHGHSRRVTGHCERIARRMGLSAAETAQVRTAGSVHDIGKINTPTRVLHNPGRLTQDELAVVRRHAVEGAALVAAIGDPAITEMVRHHHERFDGGGYPDGLAGNEIPLGARIIAVADTFDAMTSARSYRKALSHRVALEELARESGKQFDPAVVAAFRNHYSSERSVAWFSLAAAAPQRVVAIGASMFPGVGSGAIAGVGGAAQGVAAAGLAGLVGLSLGGDVGAPTSAAAPSDRAKITRTAPDAEERSRVRAPDDGKQPRGRDKDSGRVPARDRGGSPAQPRDGVAPTASPSPSKPPALDRGESPPPRATPKIQTPPVETPSVQTPAVEIPSVEVPPVKVPPIEVPSVEVPPIKIPPLDLPPIEIPGISVGIG